MIKQVGYQSAGIYHNEHKNQLFGTMKQNNIKNTKPTGTGLKLVQK